MSKEQTNVVKETRPAGESFVWLSAMGLALGIIMVVGLLGLIFWNGIKVFWPQKVYEVTISQDSPVAFRDSKIFLGSISQAGSRVDNSGDEPLVTEEYQFFVGNKDAYGLMFHYIDKEQIDRMEIPQNVYVMERREYGNAIFYPVSLMLPDGSVVTPEIDDFDDVFEEQVAAVRERWEEIRDIEKRQIGAINNEMNAIELELRKSKESGGSGEPTAAQIARRESLQESYNELKAETDKLRAEQGKGLLTYRLGTGAERTLPLGQIQYFYKPNEMGFFEKVAFFCGHLWSFLSEEPREANTEGGIFPAIFGTFVMTVLMSAAVMPFGVVAAIYLREYASQGTFVRWVRIAVNNLAGVPSIVFGVFGLGFFVYFLGGSIDDLFFAHHPGAVFGTGGIFWAALTLALMTVPVVVVATEEALASVPRGAREASLACGASKWQTIQRIVLPAAAPGILTGLILAMARGAGEVAPLMLVGVVKSANELPIDGEFPFIHLERKFMHLGFHIYDLGFQSPDSEAAKPMVFATTFILILLVLLLNLGAILIRNHLRKKYATGTF